MPWPLLCCFISHKHILNSWHSQLRLVLEEDQRILVREGRDIGLIINPVSMRVYVPNTSCDCVTWFKKFFSYSVSYC